MTAATGTTSGAAAPAETFHRLATYPVFQNVPEGVDPLDETVAEISDVTDDGRTVVYTDAAGRRVGFLDITDPAQPVGRGLDRRDRRRRCGRLPHLRRRGG